VCGPIAIMDEERVAEILMKLPSGSFYPIKIVYKAEPGNTATDAENERKLAEILVKGINERAPDANARLE